MSDETRADRLRRRRRAQRDQQAEQSDSSEPDNPSETSGPASASTGSESTIPSTAQKTDDAAESPTVDDSASVKATRVGTYMYLPEDQRSTLDFRYKELNLAYERAVGAELEKNRHFYPLVVQAGLEALDGVDGEEIRERLLQFE